jgi:serine/threonine protein kinase
VLYGLVSAEREGVVHRDLKPENVLVTADGRVKIADFGIAKATSQLNAGTFQTSAGMLIGTPTYMAPEQALGQNIGPWTDLYSVGCMAFELFTGERPFADVDSPVAVLMRHTRPSRSPASKAFTHTSPTGSNGS